MELTEALLGAIGALASVVVFLWRENAKWQERWANEVRSHSVSIELFNKALEKKRFESLGRSRN